MTTDQEKLKKLFDAALRQVDTPPSRPTPSGPPTSVFTPPVAPSSAGGESCVAVEEPVAASAAPPPVIDAAASEELARLLDEQQRRKQARHRSQALVTLAVLGAGVLSVVGWFAADSRRVQALREAWNDIRTVSDAKALAAKYQQALDRIAVRSSQIDHASGQLGVDTSQPIEHSSLDAEMKTFSGGEPTPIERTEMLKSKLSRLQETTDAN